ncbi:MAG: glycerophosphodiester phosphodiesterase [Terriglobia bacterium]
MVAHRGASGDAPENTWAAFELALRQGADAIELDVHLSADGVPVVIHDARLERTTSGSGKVHACSAKALQRLDAGSWFNRRYRGKARAAFIGQKIPLLAEVLDWIKLRRCYSFIEIKEGSTVYPGIEAKVIEQIHRAGVEGLVTVISFHLPVLRECGALDSALALGFDCTRPLLAVHRAQSVHAQSVLPHWAFASRRFILHAHRSGLAVLAWDLERPDAIRRKLLDGLDGVITGYPGRARAVIALWRAGAEFVQYPRQGPTLAGG